MANDYLDLPDPDDKKPGTGTGAIPGGAPATAAAPAPAAAVPAPAAPAQPAPPSANDIILQHLGQGGIGSDRVAAPPRQDSWWDVVPGTKYFGEPAQPGPQSWFDWFSKKYDPSPEDIATQFGGGFTYGLTPLAAQGVKSGAQALTGNDPLPAGLEPDALRERIRTASENVGPGGPLLTAAGMAANPLTYVGGGMAGIGGATFKGAEKVLPDAAAWAAEHLPESAAKWVPESLFPKSASAAAQTGTVGAANTAGQGGSPSDILKSFGENAAVGAFVPPVVEQLPWGRVTPQDIVSKTTQASQEAELAKAGIKIPRKDLGFTVASGPGAWSGDPSLGQVNELRDFLTNQAPGQGQDILLNKINAQTSSPLIQQANTAVQRAQAQADWANRLERWGSNEGLPGQTGDIREQAAAESQNYPPGSPENTAMQNIARVPTPPARVVSPNVRRALIGGGTAVGGTAEALGIPHASLYGASAGNEMANFLDWRFTPRGPGAAIQQQVTNAYPAMTGQQGPGPGANQAITNAILRLYGVGLQPGQRQ